VIRQPFWLVVSGGLLVLAIGLGVERLVFLETAIETTGTVSEVTGENSRCGSRHSRRDCTEFTASITFEHHGETYTTTTGAGSERGRDQPVSEADLHVGERVPVVFSPGDPGRAYHDSFWDLWSWPLMALAGQVATMFGAFVEPKGLRVRW
jgi:hypothetical protein